VTRAVVDSSVLVSALIAGRDTPPSQVLRAWARKRFEHVTRDEVADLLDMPRSNAVVHPDPAVVERATRDPRDDYLVALAKAAEALLVSSDRDLLDTDIGDLEPP
jgi:predicted nucleic acid-binding protein